MVEACPISGRRVDENACRVVAAMVVLLGVTAIYFGLPLILLLLTIDFFLRGCDRPELSVLSRFAKWWVRMLGLHPRMIEGAPKRFAARIGSMLSMAGGVLMLTKHLPKAGMAIALVMVACAALEAVFGLCVGCKMYSLMPRRLAEMLAR